MTHMDYDKIARVIKLGATSENEAVRLSARNMAHIFTIEFGLNDNFNRDVFLTKAGVKKDV